MKSAEKWKLCWCFSGIMAFFLVYGIMQERLMTTTYEADEDGDGERFTDTAFLVLVNRVVSIGFAVGAVYLSHYVSAAAVKSDGDNVTESKLQQLHVKAPLRNYAAVAMSNFTATYCQYEALKYVSFPTQTLGKCAKMIPVLLIGSLFHRRSYSAREYGVAFAVMLGCFLFLTGGSVASSSSLNDTPFGLLLIVIYLTADGVTSTTQERLFKQYATTTYNQMLYVNLCSAALSLAVLAVPSWSSASTVSDTIYSARLWYALDFAAKYPKMLADAVVLSLCSSFGQMIIYYTIKEFGALVYSTIMTTRQFFSVLLSALLFGHALTVAQWSGAVFVFAALWAKAWLSGGGEKRNILAKTVNDLTDKDNNV